MTPVPCEKHDSLCPDCVFYDYEKTLVKGRKQMLDAIVEILTKKRDRYTTPGDPRWGIINSDIEAIIGI